MMNTEEIVSRFQNPRKSGRGWIVRCPAHDDRKNSLSLTEADGKLLLRCQAGCDTKAVIDAVGLEWRDLFAANGNDRTNDDPVTHRYVYTDDHGKPLYRVCRTASKNFFQERYESGAYIKGLNGTRRVLFNLPEVLKAKTVFVVEGEKDAETLRSHGLVGTTNAGGADGWNDAYAESFKGKRVAIIPDNDEPGRRHAWKVAKSILPLAEMVKVVELPDGPEKGDVSDYLKDHTKEELINLVVATKAFTAAEAEREQLTEKPNEHKGESVNCYPLAGEDETPVEPQRVPFPEVAWRGVFSQWRDIVCPATEAPQEYLWAACLIVIGLVLERHVKIKNPRALYANFFALLLGRTGDDRKSTSLSFAKDSLFHIGIHDQVDILHGIQSAEAIYDSLERIDGAKTLIYCDEFRSLLNVANRKGTGDILPRLGSLYYCPPKDSLNRHGDKSTIIVNPFLSLITATPIEYVQDLLGNREIDGGFLNRFLTVTGSVQEWKPIAPEPPAVKWGQFAKPIRDIGAYYSNAECEFTFDPEAEALWRELYVAWKTARQGWNTRDQKLTARIDEHILKLAMVYSAIEKKSTITREALITAISIGRWLQTVTLDVFSEVGHSSFSRAEKIVIDVVKSKRRMYRRYLQQWVHKKGVDGDTLSKVITSLVKNGQLGEGADITTSGHKRPWVEYIPQGPVNG
jgi:Protein of unknown function (DUF3987)